MVLTGREWLVNSRAARVSRSACARLLLLSGIVAVAWLAGGIGVAYGEASSEAGGLADRVLELGDGADGVGRTAAQETRGARLSDATARAASTTGSLTGTVVPQAAALPADALHEAGVTSALDETRTGTAANQAVEDTTRTVDGTARGAGELVGGLARTGHHVVESADGSLHDSRLVDTVAEGLTDSTRAVHGRIDGAVDTAAPLDLPVIGSPDEPAVNPSGSADRRTDESDDRDAERSRTGSGASAGAAVHTPVDPGVWRSASAEAAEQAPDEDLGERIRLIAGGTHHSTGTDATGAAAPSFPVPGAAGFLMARADHLAPRTQRVALPGDPTLVVRDAADDPSFSPD